MKRSYLDTLKQQSSPIISSSQIALGVSEIHTLLAQSDSELRENDRGDGEDHQVTDSDSWLEISPLSLDSKLEKLQHEWHMGEDEGDFGLNEQSEDESDNDNDLENVSKAAAAPPSSSAGYRKLNNLVSKVESFLGHSSSVEGVEFPEL